MVREIYVEYARELQVDIRAHPSISLDRHLSGYTSLSSKSLHLPYVSYDHRTHPPRTSSIHSPLQNLLSTEKED